jgi:hypothetical protein
MSVTHHTHVNGFSVQAYRDIDGDIKLDLQGGVPVIPMSNREARNLARILEAASQDGPAL